MANSKGNPNGAGRKKGIPNKRTQSVQKMLDDMGCNPIKAMAELLLKAQKEGDTTLEAQMAKELAPYHSPKLAATKIEGGVDVKHDLIGLSETDALLSETSKGKS